MGMNDHGLDGHLESGRRGLSQRQQKVSCWRFPPLQPEFPRLRFHM